MKKLVFESLNELYGETPYYSEDEEEIEDENYDQMTELHDQFGESIDPIEFSEFCEELVNMGDSSEATRILKMLFKVYPEIEEGIETEFREGMDIFLSGYPDMAA